MYPDRQIISGKLEVTAAGTPEPLSATPVKVKKLRIKALPANGGDVYIGSPSMAAASGFVLDASQEFDFSTILESPEDEIDISTIYIDADVNSEGVCFICVE
jgi:hypothetical protein